MGSHESHKQASILYSFVKRNKGHGPPVGKSIINPKYNSTTIHPSLSLLLSFLSSLLSSHTYPPIHVDTLILLNTRQNGVDGIKAL